MATISNLFEVNADQPVIRVRPLGVISDYVVDTLHVRLDALEKSQSGAENRLIDDIYSILENLMDVSDSLGLLDVKMMYGAMVRANVLRPDNQDFAKLREILEEKIAETKFKPEIVGLTYDDIILNNPPEDVRVFTDGETGKFETKFYQGHQVIENLLGRAIGDIKRAVREPMTAESRNALLRGALEDITHVRQSMVSFYKDLPREQFMAFKPYFDTDPYRQEKGPSGAFSAKVPHLILLILGENIPQDRLDYIEENRAYFPARDFESLKETLREKISLNTLIEVEEIDPAVKREMGLTVLGFLQSHHGTVSKQMGPNGVGSAEQTSAPDFLKKRIDAYKEALKPKNEP